MSDQIVRWGFLSTAGIGRKNWKGIRNSGNGIVAAVASRSEEKARIFIDECQRDTAFDLLPRAIGSYEEILADPEIDAVYIPLPTGVRTEWVVKAAEAGKHVLAEKPAGTTAADCGLFPDSFFVNFGQSFAECPCSSHNWHTVSAFRICNAATAFSTTAILSSCDLFSFDEAFAVCFVPVTAATRAFSSSSSCMARITLSAAFAHSKLSSAFTTMPRTILSTEAFIHMRIPPSFGFVTPKAFIPSFRYVSTDLSPLGGSAVKSRHLIS